MFLVCAACGKEMQVEVELEEGQHIRCPHCGEKTSYQKPARIELPPREKPITSPKTALHVIRAAQPKGEEKPPLADNPNFETRLHMAEEHQKFYEEMKDLEHRRQQRDRIVSIGILIVLVVMGMGSYFFIHVQKEKRQRAELALATERARLDAERLKMEREERARREVEEKLAREKRETEAKLAREKREAEEKLLREKQAVERAKAENEALEGKILFQKALSTLCEGKFNFSKDMPKDREIGKCAAEFYFLLPFLEKGEVVIAKSMRDGLSSVARISPIGERTEMEPKLLLDALTNNDYLVAVDGQVYLKTKRRKPHVGQIEKGKIVDLQKEFFGDIYPAVKRYEIYPDGLCFEVVFIPKGSKKVIVTQTVENGMSYSLEKIREAVEDAFPMKGVRRKAKDRSKKFKRTVIVWDGPNKRTIDGIEYVSRTPPPLKSDHVVWYHDGYGRWQYRDGSRRENSENARERWKARYEEGLRQEKAEQEFYAQLKEENNAEFARAQTKATQAHAAYIDRILEEGTLHFRAKIQSAR